MDKTVLNRFGHEITTAEANAALASGETLYNRFRHPLTSPEAKRLIGAAADEIANGDPRE